MILLDIYFNYIGKRLDRFWRPLYLLEDQVNENHLLLKEANQLRVNWHHAYKLQLQYLLTTQTTLGWIKSFIPGFKEYQLRFQLFTSITETSRCLTDLSRTAQVCSHKLLRTTAPISTKSEQESAVQNKVSNEISYQTKANLWGKAKFTSWLFFKNKASMQHHNKEEYFYFINKHNQWEKRPAFRR